MSDTLPDWLKKALPQPRESHGQLVAARLGSGELLGLAGFTLSSAAFRNGEELDPCFTADEEDSVAPPMEWTAPPAGSEELVLIVQDPEAPGGKTFCHWAVWGLAPQKGQLLEGEAPPRVGKNSFGNSEWLLPDLPVGEDPHDFVFQLFALDTALTLRPGASLDDLVSAMAGNITALALLTATYQSETTEVLEDQDLND